MHALMAHRQRMPVARVLYYLKTNYKVIVIIKLVIVIGSGVLAAFRADTSKGIGADIVWVEVTVKVVP